MDLENRGKLRGTLDASVVHSLSECTLLYYIDWKLL